MKKRLLGFLLIGLGIGIIAGTLAFAKVTVVSAVPTCKNTGSCSHDWECCSNDCNHSGHCVAVVPTATPTTRPTATPTCKPTSTPIPTTTPTLQPTGIPTIAITPTGIPTNAPTDTPKPTEEPKQADPWDCSMDHSCQPTNSAPAGDSCLLGGIANIFVDSGIAKDNKVEVRWTPSEPKGGWATIEYWSYKVPEFKFSLLATTNDGVESVGGLVNGTNYAFRVRQVSNPSWGACFGSFSSVFDPMP